MSFCAHCSATSRKQVDWSFSARATNRLLELLKKIKIKTNKEAKAINWRKEAEEPEEQSMRSNRKQRN